MRRVHVVSVGLSWPAEDYLWRRLQGFVARGLLVTVVAEDAPRRRRLGGVRLRRLPRWHEPWPALLVGLVRDAVPLALRKPRRLRELRRSADDLRLLRAALRVARAEADVVHFEWESAAVGFVPVLESLGAPVLVSSHGGIFVRPKIGDERVTKAYAPIFARATAVHCVAEAVVREAGAYGLAAERARVIRTAVDTDFFAPPRERPAARPQLRVVGVGELSWLKGYDVALDAIALLAARGVPVRYEILGGDPPRDSVRPRDRPRLFHRVHELGLGDRVRFLGEVSPEEVRARLRAADVLLHASLTEGLPTAVLEAMACGLPVVVTDCGGLREAVTDGVEGFVCPRRSAEALGEALATLWEDPELAQRMGDAGHARVLAEFTLEQQLDRFVELFEELASAKRAADSAA